MRRRNLSGFVTLGIFVLLVVAASSLSFGQINGSSGSSVGSVLEGDRVWWSVDGVGTMKVTPHTVTAGEDVEFDFTNESDLGSIDVGVWIEGNPLEFNDFSILKDSVKTVQVRSCSTVSKVDGNGTSYDEEVCSFADQDVIVPWTRVESYVENVAGVNYYFITLNDVRKVKIKAPSFIGGSYKYSVVVKPSSEAWDSNLRVEVDPVLNGVVFPSAYAILNFEGDCADESMHENDCLQTGSGFRSDGKFEQSASFDSASASYINFTNATSNNEALDQTGSFALAAWIYPNQSGQRVIVSEYRQNSGGQRGFKMQIESGSNAIWCHREASGGEAFVESKTAVTLSSWNHVACVYNKTSGNFSVWVNGVSDTDSVQRNPDTSATDNDMPAILGMDIDGPFPSQNEQFIGMIDNVCYYDTYLNNTQIEALYNLGTGAECPNEAANEGEGDDAIKLAIDSSVPNATQYKTQQVYVVNSSNDQNQGTIDYLVVQTSPQRRWLLNYITSGESYLNAVNLSDTVYVLEITDKSTNDIIQEVSTLINATK